MGLLALAGGGGYLVADVLDAGLDLDGVDGAVIGGVLLLVVSLALIARVLAQLGQDKVQP